MNNNIIYNDKDETIGYYNDLYKLYEGEITRAVKTRNIEGAKQYLEELDEMSELANYDGLIILSDNNGMGFTARPYKESER